MKSKQLMAFGSLLLNTFPSPCGEEVMKSLLNYTLGDPLGRFWFPSPCGEEVMK